MKLSDFDFDLPERLIATRPVRPRPAARLLYATLTAIENRLVSDLPALLGPGDRLVLNDTKVIPARLDGRRIRMSDQGRTEAKVEVTLLSPLPEGAWMALAKPGKRLREGEVIEFSADHAPRLSAEVLAKIGGEVKLQFHQTGAAFDAGLEAAGKMPLPPYIAALRPVDARDNDDYQTVFAAKTGAVAAPTASLHFDDGLLADLAAKGVAFTKVTLHVGAGTFLPVKTDDISAHRMHAEWGHVSDQAVAEIAATKHAGGRVIPVGTTALRLIETAARSGAIAPFRGETDIFIRPGFEFQVTDGLMTNFHLPKSTLMMLVSALMGSDRIRQIYDHAIAENYRFFSYGDASLLLPEG